MTLRYPRRVPGRRVVENDTTTRGATAAADPRSDGCFADLPSRPRPDVVGELRVPPRGIQHRVREKQSHRRGPPQRARSENPSALNIAAIGPRRRLRRQYFGERVQQHHDRSPLRFAPLISASAMPSTTTTSGRRSRMRPSVSAATLRLTKMRASVGPNGWGAPAASRFGPHDASTSAGASTSPGVPAPGPAALPEPTRIPATSTWKPRRQSSTAMAKVGGTFPPRFALRNSTLMRGL